VVLKMISLTGLNHVQMYLNADHIEKMEQVPETLITLTNGKKYIVLETPKEVINRVIEYKRKIFTLGL
jgi:flagellar protein FlbD